MCVVKIPPNRSPPSWVATQSSWDRQQVCHALPDCSLESDDPLPGIMLADYFIVRRCQLSLGDMFRKKDSIYWNTYGVNIRAIVAFVCGVAPTLPGFIRNVGETCCVSQIHLTTTSRRSTPNSESLLAPITLMLLPGQSAHRQQQRSTSQRTSSMRLHLSVPHALQARQA